MIMGNLADELLDFTPQCHHLRWLCDHLDGWQFGDQGLIEAICSALKTKGDCVEYGAGDGDSLPLTIDRMYHIGNVCWAVEIDESKQIKLEEKYPLAIVKKSLNWKACEDAAENGLAVVVIDIDGQDSFVMRQMLQAGVRPTLLVVEHFDNHYPIGTSASRAIPEWMLGLKLETGHAIQDTAETLHAIATANGYERIGFNRCNSFFVVKERFTDLFR